MRARLPLTVVAAALTFPLGAQARSTAVLPYPTTEVWPAAVRFLRVDRGFPIREKDEASGYVLFDLVDGQKSYKGSLELVSTPDDEGRAATRLVVTLPDLPRHYEVMLIDKLGAKVRDERGAPAAPPPKAPAAKAPAESPPRRDAGDGLPRPPTMKGLPR